ncbi:nephrin-like [Penaeus chinensis]|uniref:nephrin-like n=1 Tax=Penaeus chinensis TaxID=139456 RepID=UPI001FB7DD67|nr:nephrin-like [Penaeus chinensis]
MREGAAPGGRSFQAGFRPIYSGLCFCHFIITLNSSSRRTHLSLHVVELPGQPVLRVGGQRATDGVLGPLQEGTALDITCSVSGGVPPPKVVWKRQEKILDPTVESRSLTLTVNQLNIARLTRAFHNVRLTCVASNNNVTAPVEASITVTMNQADPHPPPDRLSVSIPDEVSCLHSSSCHLLLHDDECMFSVEYIVPFPSCCGYICVVVDVAKEAPCRMLCAPLVTRLEAPPKGLRVGREYEISCISAGSRPHPNITWTLGNVASLTPITAITEHGVNMSTSRVRVTASRRHHGQRLTCTSLNPLFPAYPLSDSILLNVTYPPVATIELGRGVSSVVKEGEDIYFNCNVDSNPPTYKISWYHKGRSLLHAPDRGLLLTGNSLALRSVTRHQAGPYMCAASNVEGDAQSRPLNLSVNYSPVCSDDSSPSRVYATGLGQYINVTCTVKASPSVAKYLWAFNNSVTTERIPGDQVFKTPEGGSVVKFIARAHQDYGTLQCWAQNSVGRMAQPCLFHVVPAGRPDPPMGCSVVNKTYDSLAVGCTPGFDGGLEQTFLAKVFEAVTGRSQVNVSSRWPNFTLEGLTPGLDYIIQVMARNALGNSDPVRLEAFTYKMAENRMRDEQVEEEPGEEGPAAGVLLGSLVVVVVLVLVLALLVRCLWARRGQEGHRGRGKSRGYAPPEKPGGGLSDEEELHFEVPTISLEAHRDPITHIADQAL